MVHRWHVTDVLVHCVHYRTGIRKVETPLDSCEPFTMMVRIEERKQLNLGGQNNDETIKILTSGLLDADLATRLVACASQLRPVWRPSDCGERVLPNSLALGRQLLLRFRLCI